MQTLNRAFTFGWLLASVVMVHEQGSRAYAMSVCVIES
jgi:hypothetical protein